MIIGLDHVVVGVRDLRAAVETFQERLGFIVSDGGVHPNQGTRNALIRFTEHAYIELIAIDTSQPAGSQEANRWLKDLLARGEGPVGFAFETNDLNADVPAVVDAGVQVGRQRTGSRRTPDGSVLSWTMVETDLSAWRSPLPFLIQWMSRDTKPATATHPVGARGISAIDIVVDDVERWAGIYRDAFGLHLVDISGELAELRQTQTTFRLLRRATRDEPNSASRDRRRVSPGVARLEITVDNLDEAMRRISGSGAVHRRSLRPSDSDEISIQREHAHGLELTLRAT